MASASGERTKTHSSEPSFRLFGSAGRGADSSSAASFATPSPLSLLGGRPTTRTSTASTWATRPAGLSHRRTGWTYAADATDPLSPANDAFLSTDQSVRVSAWSVPPMTARRWKTAHRSRRGSSRTAKRTQEDALHGISTRAVPLCLERRDCHPGFLVPFAEDTLAFFTGGIVPEGKVVVVAVWRPESDPNVAPYGGARHLLEAFLSTMHVWPIGPVSRPDGARKFPARRRRHRSTPSPPVGVVPDRTASA